MRLLLVDDDPMALAVVAQALAKSGHDIETAGGGLEALAKLADEPFRVLVCDWEMPGMDGPELCRAARAASHDDLYVIMLTARSGEVARLDALHAGADDYLPKPFDLQDLLSSLRAGELVLAEKSAA